MTTVDIVHAVPVDKFNSNGRVLFSLQDYVVSGPQKALQSLIVMLLSTNLPLVNSQPLLATLRRNNIRDLATLANKYTRLVSEILPMIDDPSRPDNERILSSSVVSFASLGPDSGVITIEVISRAKENFKYEVPIEI